MHRGKMFGLVVRTKGGHAPWGDVRVSGSYKRTTCTMGRCPGSCVCACVGACVCACVRTCVSVCLVLFTDYII